MSSSQSHFSAVSAAADVLLMAYPERFKDPQLMKFYEYLKDVLTQPEPGLPTQTSASNWPGWNWLSTKKKGE